LARHHIVPNLAFGREDDRNCRGRRLGRQCGGSAVSGDPVALGLVASLTQLPVGVEVAPKRLELLHELVPTATILA
jgi:hypothetical protein